MRGFIQLELDEKTEFFHQIVLCAMCVKVLVLN